MFDISLNVAIALHQLLRFIKIKLRVLTQEAEERLHVTFEPDRVFNAADFFIQFLRVSLADFMNLFRCHVGSRVVFNLMRIQFLATRQCAYPVRFTGVRQILFCHEIAQALVGRDDLVRYRAFVGGNQAFTVLFGYVVGKILQWLVEDTVCHIFDYVGLQQRQDTFDYEIRKHDAFTHANAHIGNGLIDPGYKSAKPSQPVVIIFNRVKRLCRSAGPKQGDKTGRAEHLRHRHEGIETCVTVTKVFDGHKPVIFEYVIAQSVLTA